MKTFDQFKSLAASEKLTLATVDASKRLLGWMPDVGSIYKLVNFDTSVIVALENQGTTYGPALSYGTLASGQYFNDRAAKALYLFSPGGTNPNAGFVVLTQTFFFASAPVVLANDLANGFEVFWEPMIQSSSQFGVEMDTINQASEAIEGSGDLTLVNDQDFWKKNFEKLSFENKRVSIYSYGRDLDATEAKLIFRGYTQKKTYTQTAVKLTLLDQISKLNSTVPLAQIGALGALTPASLNTAFQRMVLGRVVGHKPTNIDQVLSDGYPISGTVTVNVSSATVIGSGTDFYTQLSPGDSLVFQAGGNSYSIASITSSTSLELSQLYADGSSSGVHAYVKPAQPKRWQNRSWKLAGHALRQPVTLVTHATSIINFYVNDSTDIRAGDILYVGDLGSGELVTVANVSGKNIRLKFSMNILPAPGAQVIRPAIQNLRINDIPLSYYRDFTLDAPSATLVLRTTAEANAQPWKQINKSVTFTTGSRTVTGSGFKGIINPGCMVGLSTNDTAMEVLSVEDDSNLTLRGPAVISGTANLRYKDLIYDPSVSLLSCDLLGRTSDGTSTGSLLATAPQISKALLTDLGLGSVLNVASFTEADSFAPFSIGMVVPANFSDTSTFTYRDTLNTINKSVLGSVVQSNDFQLIYCTLQPDKKPTALRFSEADVITLNVASTAENVVATTTASYAVRESNWADPNSKESYAVKTSQAATYLVKSSTTKLIPTVLSDSGDAYIVANRWAFLLESSAGSVTLTTKLQAINLQVGDTIILDHRKLFDRLGGSSYKRILFVESVKKSGATVKIGCVDLSNAFNRVANIADPALPIYATATDEQRLFGGFYTDDYGMILTSDDTITNVIW